MRNNETTLPAETRTRPWLQFRLRTLLIAMTAVAVCLGYYFSPTKREGRATQSLQDTGIKVLYDYQSNPGASSHSYSYSYRKDPPGPSLARTVFGEEFFQKPEWLKLNNTVLEPNELMPLQELPELRRITLTGCGIGDLHMANFGRLRSLESLSLRSNEITDVGIAHLSNAKKLQTLGLSKNKITGDGFRELAEHSDLKQLFLHDNPITDDGVGVIAGFPNLEMLGLAGTEITDACVEDLSKMKSLRYLGITRTAVSAAAAERLKIELPNCEIEHARFRGQ